MYDIISAQEVPIRNLNFWFNKIFAITMLKIFMCLSITNIVRLKSTNYESFREYKPKQNDLKLITMAMSHQEST